MQHAETEDKIFSFTLILLSFWFCISSMPMDMLQRKEFVEKISKYSHRYNSLDQETDKKALLQCQELEVAQLLSNVGITHEKSEIEGLLKSPLHFMCSQNKPEILHLFLLQGANVEGHASCTPLHEACLKDKLENVRVLLYHGADTNARDHVNQTPLMYAIQSRSCYITEELWPYLDKHEIDNVSDVNGQTVLMQLLEAVMPDFALRLLEMDPDVNIVDSEQRSALYYSIITEDPRCFAVIFPRVSNLQLLDGFFQLFLECCRFSITAFKVALFKILDSPHIEHIARSTINSILKPCSCSITSLLLLKRYFLGKEDFFKALYVMLSYGAAVEEFDYDVILPGILRKPCNIEYELFKVIVEVSPHHISLFSPKTVVLLERNTIRKRLPFSKCSPGNVFSYIIAEWLNDIDVPDGDYMFPIHNICTLLEYTAGQSVALEDFRDCVQDMYGVCSPEYVAVIVKVERILSNNSVPSLLQLARDAVRIEIINSCKCRKMVCDINVEKTTMLKSSELDYHWCIQHLVMGVRQLQISQHLKDVLMLKTPLYNYDHLEEVISETMKDYFEDL